MSIKNCFAYYTIPQLVDILQQINGCARDVKHYCSQCSLCASRKGPAHRPQALLQSYNVGTQWKEYQLMSWDLCQKQTEGTNSFQLPWTTSPSGQRHSPFQIQAMPVGRLLGGEDGALCACEPPYWAPSPALSWTALPYTARNSEPTS